MSQLIIEANERYYPPCPICHALAGDPCRTPSWKIREPHPERFEPKPTATGLPKHGST